MKNYKKQHNPETGTKITYNIQDLKLYPGKLQKRMNLKEHEYEYNKTQTPQQNWENGKQIQTTLLTICPHAPKTQDRKEADWISEQTQWVNESERQTTEYFT